MDILEVKESIKMERAKIRALKNELQANAKLRRQLNALRCKRERLSRQVGYVRNGMADVSKEEVCEEVCGIWHRD
jgi:hypothetical protein